MTEGNNKYTEIANLMSLKKKLIKEKKNKPSQVTEEQLDNMEAQIPEECA